MATEDAFTPRLGKIRDRGAAGGARLRKRVTTTAKQLGRARTKSTFTGKRLGRGKASAIHAHFSAQRYSALRRRRVIVKAHIAKPGKVAGAGVFKKHINYLQRDGVERDGSGGELYSREGKTIDADAFADRSQKDRHQFRFIVSPEDANQISDLKSYTRELMEIMERDLGTRLDWVAVDHHNTGHSHTHIVVRGKNAAGRDLIIAPDYWSRGFRERASVLATQRLGPRRTLEIMRQQAREVEQERLTGIDRQLLRLERDGKIKITPASTTKDRFERDLRLQRLKNLEQMRLVEREASDVWEMQPGWANALKGMGRRGDIIKAIAAGLEPGQVPEVVRFFDERRPNAAPIIGAVRRHGPSDELRDTRFLLVRDFDGNTWHVKAGELKDGPLPPRGSIVGLAHAGAEPRTSDRTINEIAERSDGYYSDEIHVKFDPSASSAYRLAHKRRLEALRRVGIVTREKDGSWRIGRDYLDRVRAHESAQRSVRIEIRSWLPLKQQVTAVGETWLDRIDRDVASTSSDPILKTAKEARIKHLRHRSLLAVDQDLLKDHTRMQMNNAELDSANSSISDQLGKHAVRLETGTSFEGTFKRTIDLGQGRFALLEKSKEFALVPWRRDMERYRGRSLIIEARKRGVSWRFPGARNRGLSR